MVVVVVVVVVMMVVVMVVASIGLLSCGTRSQDSGRRSKVPASRVGIVGRDRQAVGYAAGTATYI